MCLAVPMQVRTVDGFNCGYAIQKVSEEEAADTWQLFDEVLAAEV